MSKQSKCLIYYDGNVIKGTLQNLEISYECYESACLQSFSADGIVNEIRIEGTKSNMCYEEKACDDGYERENLAEAAVYLKATKEQRLLKKYGVVRDNGTLTERGQQLLLQVLVQDAEIAKKLVDTLVAIDEEAKEK